MSEMITRRFAAGYLIAIAVCMMAACGQDDANRTLPQQAAQSTGVDVELGAKPQEFAASGSTTNRTNSAAAQASVVEPGFDVVRTAFSPDGNTLALVGKGVAATLALADADLGPIQGTAIKGPVWTQYAPDGSEIWIGDQRGTLQRLHPQSGVPIVSDAAWVTQAGDVNIVSPQLGAFSFEQGGRRAEVAGRIVAGSAGELEFGGAVYVAKRPDAVLRFFEGSVSGDTDQPVQPVGAMAVACGGQCLLTAADAQALETYLWAVSPYSPTPVRLAGRMFLDDGNASLDESGKYALMLSAKGLRRVALPPGTAPDGLPLQGAVSGARLSSDARHAFVMDDTRGWRIYESADMSQVMEPDWLDAEQHMAAVAPDGRRAVFADRSGSLRLTDVAYVSLRTFDVDPELAAFHFSKAGTFFAYRSDGGFELLYSADGSSVATLPGSTLMFSPGDRYAVTLGESLRILRLPLQDQ